MRALAATAIVALAALALGAGHARADNLFSATTTTLTVDPAATVVNQPITYTATVTSAQGGNPTGTVEFDLVNGTASSALGSAPLAAGPAGSNYSTAVLRQPSAAGSFTVTATFRSASPLDWFSSTSTGVALTVQTITVHPTAIVLVHTPARVVAGKTVKLVATVHETDGTTKPTGTVTFTLGAAGQILGSVQLDGTGKARFTTGGWRPGRYLLQANYGGDATDRLSHAGFVLTVTRPKPHG